MPVPDELRELNQRAWNGEKGEQTATICECWPIAKSDWR